MNLDRRLHHAARELRELDIPIPPLSESPPSHHSRPMALMACIVVLIAGSVAGAATVLSQEPTVEVAITVEQPTVGNHRRVAAASRVDAVIVHPLEELAMIDQLGAATVDAPAHRPIHPGVI